MRSDCSRREWPGGCRLPREVSSRKPSLEAALQVDQQTLVAEVQPAVEAAFTHVRMRSEAVIADTCAEVLAEHPGRSGPQIGPVAVDTLIAEREHLGGSIDIQVRRNRPLPPKAEDRQRRRHRIRLTREGGTLLYGSG